MGINNARNPHRQVCGEVTDATRGDRIGVGLAVSDRTAYAVGLGVNQRLIVRLPTQHNSLPLFKPTLITIRPR
jgi:hypothetical protein